MPLGLLALALALQHAYATVPVAAAAATYTAAPLEPAHPPSPFALFTSGDLNVTEYRIPVLLALHNGTTLLAFAEARLPCVQSCGKAGVGGSWGDSSPNLGSPSLAARLQNVGAEI